MPLHGVGTSLVGDWIDPNPSLEVTYNRKKSLDPPGTQNPDRPVSNLFINFVFTIPGCLLKSIKLVNFSQTHPCGCV